MKQLFPFLRGNLKQISRGLRICLLSGFVFILMLSSQAASAHTLTPGITAGTVCTYNCQGGYEVFSYSGFGMVEGLFQVPCPAYSGSASIWVEMGGHVDVSDIGDANTVGLAAGIVLTPTTAYLAVNSTGLGGSGLRTGSAVRCGDYIQAIVSGPNTAFVEDVSVGSPYYTQKLQFSGGPAAFNIDTKCVVQADPNTNLEFFGTLTFIGQCRASASTASSLLQDFGTWTRQSKGAYLSLRDNAGRLMAADPNILPTGLAPGTPEQIRWDAPN